MNARALALDAAAAAVAATAPWQLHASGERLLIVELPGADRVAANRLARDIAARVGAEQLPFIADIVPAMTTVGIHYHPALVPLDAVHTTPWRALVACITALLGSVAASTNATPRVVDIPVCYGGEFGPDLEEVAERCGMSAAQVIECHSKALVDVMMLGFAPGHPYIGLLDERLNPPRRATPRTAVVPGTIGLANRQSVIYPLMLPGGWNLIGRTPLELFAPSREGAPCLVSPGDQVRFAPITPEQFHAMTQDNGAER